ncbi:MAG: hypothetical protein RDU41_10285, partial [Clostridia bacterium]|nr:hypothetical protein [Clostridia bacterium]
MSDRARQKQIVRLIVNDVREYSRRLRKKKSLRPYQVEPALCIIDSIENRKSKIITVMISRQGGKNETSAQLEGYLMTRYKKRGGTIVKAAPTWKPQIVNSMMRLKEVLDNPLTKGLHKGQFGFMRRLGNCLTAFFSAQPTAEVVGATASILLEIDEAQDVEQQKYDKDFAPMGADQAVTTVFWGTAWDTDNMLERQRQTNKDKDEALARERGCRVEDLPPEDRHNFEYNAHEVAKHNPNYEAYFQREIERLGEDHPIILTQYLLQAIAAAGKFFSPQQRVRLQGEYARYHQPTQGKRHVAAIDIAGKDEEAQDAALRDLKPQKDSTVLLIGELDFTACDGIVNIRPRVNIVEITYRTGHDFDQQKLELLADLQVWKPEIVVVDAVGIGADTAAWLGKKYGSRVIEHHATDTANSEDAYEILARINTGLLKMFENDQSEEYQEFWNQAKACRYELKAGKRMRFFVPESEGHDD